MKFPFKQKPKSPLFASGQPASRNAPHQTKKSRLGFKITVLILLLCSGYWLWQKIRDPRTLPIHSVKIIGSYSNIDHQSLRQAITPYLRNGMIGIDLDNLKAKLAQIPWVQHVHLSRAWPDGLIINLTEQTPVAHWNNTDLLSASGEVFHPNSDIAKSLPWLNGPLNQQKILWEGYQEMSHILTPSGLQIIWINLSGRQSWQIRLNNGLLLILGQEDILLRLKRFVSIYPKFFAAHINDIEYIDLRYANGLAVKWKNDNTKNSSPTKS